MDDKEAWALEERFWLEGAPVYAAFLDPACLMVFPGMGVMAAGGIRESLRSAPRWASVAMTDRAIGRAGRDVLVLAYRAEGRRDGEEPYRCLCTSTYRLDGDRWMLVQHQQTLAQ